MIEITLLGTGGTMPLPGRALTALYCRCGGKSLLIDCGEGTQVKIREKKLSMKSIDMILFTHFHADHIAGLPGLLLSMGKDGRRSPVELIGPVGLKKMVKGLCAIIPELPYRLQMKEIENREADYRLDKLRIEAFRVDHSVPCYGYAFYLDRAPRFEPDKARALGIAPQYWGKLQKGERLTVEGKTICPDMVLGEERKGIHFTYVTDTRPAVCIRRFAKESDLLICEGMYGDEDKKEMALLKRHMLFREAAEIAREAGVKELWLTHYSPSLHDPGSYAEACKAIFPYLVAAEDLQSVTLCFPKQ